VDADSDEDVMTPAPLESDQYEQDLAQMQQLIAEKQREAKLKKQLARI
jgi:hypothetical protein